MGTTIQATEMSKFLSALIMLSLCVTVNSTADPGFTWPGTYIIRPDPSPGIVNDVNEITVLTLNHGTTESEVNIQLSYNDWGVTYKGWQEIGTYTYDIPANGNAEHVFTHIFETRAHVCLEAKVLNVSSGGNSDTTNDRTQINWEVVNVGDTINIYVPFGNGADEEIVVNGTEILCMINETFVPCPGRSRGDIRMDDGDRIVVRDPVFPDQEQLDPFFPDQEQLDPFFPDQEQLLPPPNRRLLQSGLAPFLQFAPSTLAPHSEQIATLVVPDIPDGGMVVMVQAYMNNELNHVMINLVKTTVHELLNTPHLCCIKSLRTRLMLEKILRDALAAYENGECKAALKLLRSFIQKATLLECELSAAEKACIEKALLKVVDAARMIALELGSSLMLPRYVQDGDYFRRQGVYEAAVMEYARGC